jgi:hypothetical protein
MKQFNFNEIEDAIWNELPIIVVGDTTIKDLYATKSYIYALQKALYQGIYVDLYILFEKEVPIHPKFLPILSAILKRAKTKDAGRPPQLTPSQEVCIHRLVSKKCFEDDISIKEACSILSALSNDESLLPEKQFKRLSESTIYRAFNSVDKELFDNKFTQLLKR